MIFTRLRLQNFGLFRGDHEFDLRPTLQSNPTCPIILFGGKNGAGKTTILDSVRVCLFGRRALGSRVRRVDYENYLKGRIHRPSDGEECLDKAAVTLDFEHMQAGRRSAYSVTRSWRRNETGVNEELLVRENGEPLSDLHRDHWEDFVKELVPPGIAQLFFFDGEKIQALAEDGPNNEELANSVKSLLGIDIVERLEADLAVYVSRREDTRAASDAQAKLASLEAEHEALTATLG